MHFFAGGFEMQDWTEFRGVKIEFWLEYGGPSRDDQYKTSII